MQRVRVQGIHQGNRRGHASTTEGEEAVKPIASPKHYRNGPEMDVAMCGERGLVRFSRARGGVTCAECRMRLDAAISRRALRRSA